jgi:hypothetical protein
MRNASSERTPLRQSADWGKRFQTIHHRSVDVARGRKPPTPRTSKHIARRPARMWCRLKDRRRLATRYDKLARNHLAGALIAAAVTYWIN